MRKRKWQTLLYIFLIFVLFYIHMIVQQMYFSPEDAFYACERGLRYPLSEEIVLEFEGEDGEKVLVGRQEEGLFVVPVEKTHLFFWRMKSGGGIDGFFKCDKPLNVYLTYGGNLLGMCQDENITEASVIVGRIEELNWTETTFPVEEGLIFMEESEIFHGVAFDPTRDYVLYAEGRNAAGEVLCWEGDEDVAEYLRTGNIRSSRIKNTVEGE